MAHYREFQVLPKIASNPDGSLNLPLIRFYTPVYLKLIRVLTLALGLVVPGYASDPPVKKSLKLVKEGSLSDAEKLLRGAQAKKQDDFGIDYVFSLFFLSPYQKTLKLDSSYVFCLSAIEKFKKATLQDQRRYVKLDIDSAELYSRKDYLDSLGFSQAERLESEAAYQYFLERFPQSRLAETAKQKRASLAFQRAKTENSYEAFMTFLDKYPDAEQARSAKEISDLLVFENTAKKGHIADWEAFIERNPNNPYVLKAQNRLYELSTLNHSPKSYQAFIYNYPENPNVSRAWEWIFYLDKSPKNLYQMAQKYPGFPLVPFESRFQNRNTFVMSFVERGKFGMMLGPGNNFVKPVFDSIPEDYKCEMTWTGFLKLFRNHRATLFSLDSIPISDGEYDNADFFSDGLLKVYKGGRQGLFSMTGYQILGPRYESISRLTPNLLSIQQGSKLYLFTTKGQKLDISPLDEILPVGTYLALKKGEKYALVKEEDVLHLLENEPVEVDYRYNKVQRIGLEKILLFQDREVNFVSKGKIYVLPTKPSATFEETSWGLSIRSGKSVTLIDTNGNELPKSYESVYIYGQCGVAKINNRFGLINRQGNTTLEFIYDTIAPLLRNSFIARNGNRRVMIFENSRRINFSSTKAPEVLRYTSGKTIVSTYFIVLTDSLNRKGLFNKQGRQILPFAYDHISMLDKHLISIGLDKKNGVADTHGVVLLKPTLAGVSAVNRDFVCVAKGRSFFILNPYTKKAVPTSLSAIAKPFGPTRSFFIVRVADKAGVLDASGKLVIPAVYEEIMYWNPTRCLVKRNGFWYFYVPESGKELVKAMKSVRVLMERENEIIYQVEADRKVGVESTLRGEIAPTDNDEIVPFEAGNQVYFFAGRRVQQSSVYNLSYIDQNGQLVKTQLLTEDEYEKIVCD